MSMRGAEFSVGVFMVAGILALMALAFKVSGFTYYADNQTYTLYADFDNIGGLKERSLVAIAGVPIGRISSITLNNETFKAHVALLIDKAHSTLPVDTMASIFTQGLLGANYVSLTPGFDSAVLKNHDSIETTHSALILENLIGQLLFSVKNPPAKTTPMEEKK